MRSPHFLDSRNSKGDPIIRTKHAVPAVHTFDKYLKTAVLCTTSNARSASHGGCSPARGWAWHSATDDASSSRDRRALKALAALQQANLCQHHYRTPAGAFHALNKLLQAPTSVSTSDRSMTPPKKLNRKTSATQGKQQRSRLTPSTGVVIIIIKTTFPEADDRRHSRGKESSRVCELGARFCLRRKSHRRP